MRDADSSSSSAPVTWPPGWPFALAPPVLEGEYRLTPEDFQVEEQFDFAPEGAGEHLWVWVEKRGINTAEVARLLAASAGVAVRDVGFSGLKDRDAVTRQWFSLALPGRALPDGWAANLAERGVRCRDAIRHPRKLKRGVHRGNRFRLRIAGEAAQAAQTRERWEMLVASGVPNYFGPQRFGPDGRNLHRALSLLARGWRKRQDPQGLLLSSARSYLFNAVLAARVEDGSWGRPLPGDVLNLEGTASRFAVTAVDVETLARAASGDVHPTGPMWGAGELQSDLAVAERERSVANAYPVLSEGIAATGTRQNRRALRVMLQQAAWTPAEAGSVWLEFTLPRGAFATAVLRELFRHSTLI